MVQRLVSNKDPVKDSEECFELFYGKGWTDGLPILAPTEAKVLRCLEHVGLSPDVVIGTMPEMGRQIIAEKVAINAVMAGCLPEYMPVVVAAVEAMTDPAFSLHALCATTGGTAVVCVVGGPIAREIGMNAGEHCLGPGNRANATIGRAIHLIKQNVCGITRKMEDRSTHSQPGKYTYCFAELDNTPWHPLHEVRGCPKGSSGVTVFGGYGQANVMWDNYWAEKKGTEQLASAARRITQLHISRFGLGGAVVVCSGPEVEQLAREGWTQEAVRQYMYENACRSLADLKRRGGNRAHVVKGHSLLEPVRPGDESILLSWFDCPEAVLLAAAGDNIERIVLIPAQAEHGLEFLPVTKPIRHPLKLTKASP